MPRHIDGPSRPHRASQLRLRLIFEGDAMLGPGKAELLENIHESGSISEAGRRMAMSYKRAWTLVDEMNNAFRMPLVESSRGGARGGGARLTEAGTFILASYRSLEARVAEAGAPQIEAIRGLLNDIADQK